MKHNKIHLIGNAHLDPVFLWALPDGLSEIKATFRSALDRIKQFDDFVFTSAAISYYAWIEENCPEMFKELREAVASGHWSIVGAMWVQPDCNLISAESFARHMLYSQKFTRERFGVTVKTGYNVDSFGHTASLPKLLNEGGAENYVYMRPAEGEEKQYPFSDCAFRWKYNDGEVTAFRIIGGYGENLKNDEKLREFDSLADGFDHDIMIFYGVGNHGGGPTIRNVREIHKFMPSAKHEFVFSSPDRFFDSIKAQGTALPEYEGDLQNHASGCYSANSYVKAANRFAEDRLAEAEKWLVTANILLGRKNEAAMTEEAWKGVLFNQFHDLLCGCAVESAFDDAKGDFEFARSVSFKLKSCSLQAISWAIDTDRGVGALSKDCDWLWEAEDLGTPVVVFNPLSFDATVPIRIRKPRYCAGVTYVENGREIALPYQEVRGDMTEHDYKTVFTVNAPVPALGYRTFWVYAQKEHRAEKNGVLRIGEHFIENDVVRVEFDPKNGCISAFSDKHGKNYVGGCASKPVLIDDSGSDTWAHGNFVFDKTAGEFSSPEFKTLEHGECVVSLEVKQHCGGNYITQTYSLYPHDKTVHVGVRLFMCDELKIVKLKFEPAFAPDTAIYGCAGGIAEKPADGREQPMQRFVCVTNSDSGLAVCTDSKFSASADGNGIAFIAVRTCYYSDHMGERDGRMTPQDIGVNEFNYTLSPFEGDIAEVEKTSELLRADFPLINETYHKGELGQSASLLSVAADNVLVTAIKAAEDGKGLIFRLREIAGKKADTFVEFCGESFGVSLLPNDIATYRFFDGRLSRTDFTEA